MQKVTHNFDLFFYGRVFLFFCLLGFFDPIILLRKLLIMRCIICKEIKVEGCVGKLLQHVKFQYMTENLNKKEKKEKTRNQISLKSIS